MGGCHLPVRNFSPRRTTELQPASELFWRCKLCHIKFRPSKEHLLLCLLMAKYKLYWLRDSEICQMNTSGIVITLRRMCNVSNQQRLRTKPSASSDDVYLINTKPLWIAWSVLLQRPTNYAGICLNFPKYANYVCIPKASCYWTEKGHCRFKHDEENIKLILLASLGKLLSIFDAAAFLLTQHIAMGVSKGSLFICVGLEAQLSVQSSEPSANPIGLSSAEQIQASICCINSLQWCWSLSSQQLIIKGIWYSHVSWSGLWAYSWKPHLTEWLTL